MSRQRVHLPLTMLVRLAWRNLWRHRRRTLITLFSIAVGFALAVLFIGMGDGSHNSMIRNAINMGEGHLTIQPQGYLEAPANHKFLQQGEKLEELIRTHDVDAVLAPRVSLQLLASTANNSVGAGLEGMDMQADPRVEMLRDSLVEGDWLSGEDHRGVLIGSGMARKLKIGLGGKVVLMSGTQSGDTQAQLGRVRGIFESGIQELDDFLVLSDLAFSRRFLAGEGADLSAQPITRLAIFLPQPDQLAQVKGHIHSLLESAEREEVQLLDWMEMMPQLVQFIALDDIGNYVFLVLILVLVVFGILNTVLMSVLERTREFGLLRALGLNRYHLLVLVLCESLLLSLLAVCVGWLAGGGTHWWFSSHGIDFSALMSEGTSIMGTVMDPIVYTELSQARVVQLTAIVFIATLASGIYPAIKAARVYPVEALRT